MNRLPGEELVALGEVAAAEEAPVRAQRGRVRGPGKGETHHDHVPYLTVLIRAVSNPIPKESQLNSGSLLILGKVFWNRNWIVTK